MIVCTCGSQFRTIKTGTNVIVQGALYAADLKECPECHSRILDPAATPIAFERELVAEIVGKLDDKHMTVYGRL